METPHVRPGKVLHVQEMPRVIAFFRNSAQGNAAVQLLVGMGVPGDLLGITPPDEIEGGQGMLLSIACPDESLIPRVEDVCRRQGAEVRQQRR